MQRYEILLVSENMTLREEVFDVLRGYDLTHVLAVEDAKNTLAQKNPDATILDIAVCPDNLPGAIENLTARGVEPPVVALVSDYQMDMAAAALGLGAFDYVLLPMDAESLIGAVNKASEAQNLLEQVLFLKPQVSGMEDHPQPAALIKKLARSIEPVLIRGENGSGVDLVARSLHFNGSRRDGPFVEVACANLPPNLLESDIFGYEKGAVAGGMVHKSGQAELAEGGTLFIQNVESLGGPAQLRLAKCINEKRLTPIGADMSTPWDARVIVSAEVDLPERIRTRLFGKELYELIADNVVYLPPLRERRHDIPELINYYLEKYRRFHRRGPIIFSEVILKKLSEYPWPGNLWELEKTIERYVLSGVMPSSETTPSVDEVTGIESVGSESSRPIRNTPLKKAARAAERDLIIETLKRYGGNKRKSAKALKVSYKTLFNKLHQYNIVAKVDFE